MRAEKVVGRVAWCVTKAVSCLLAVSLTGCFSESPEQLLASAKSHLEKKDSAAAVIQLKNALQADAELAEARFLLGKVLLENGDVGAAVIELGKARDAGYAGEELSALLARSLFLQAQFDKLLTEYGKVELASPQWMAELQVTLSTAHALRGQMDEARSRIDRALALDAGNVRAQLVHARLLAGTGGPALALEALEALLATHADHAEAWQLKGELLAFAGRTDEAITALRRAVKLDKKNLAAHSGLLSLLSTTRDRAAIAEALADFKAGLPNHPQLRLFIANQALDDGDLKTAHEHVQVLLKAAPEDGRVQFLAGAVEFRRGALLQAESHLSKALRLAPKAQRVRVLLARTHLRSGEAAKAMSVLQPALDDSKGDADVFAAAAEAQLQLGNAKQAEAYLQQAVKLNPQDARSRTALAVASIGKGRGEQGIDELRAISADDSSATADLALISALVRKNDLSNALLAIEGLERKQPNKPLAPMLRGGVELRRGNPAQARQAFEAALRVDPVYYPAAASLASLDVMDKKAEAAITRFEKMLVIDPRHVQAQLAIVGLRAQAGASKEELADLLIKSIKQSPEAVAPRVALTRLQLDRKEINLALAVVQEGVAALPDSPELQELLGQVLLASGDAHQALIAFNKMAVLQPTSPLPFMRIAELHMASKNVAAAEQSLKRALGVKPDFAPAHVALIRLELAAGQVAQALALIRVLQQQSPQSPLGQELEGDLEAQQKNWSRAIAAYRSSLDKRPQTDLAIKLHRSLGLSAKNDEAKVFEASWRKRYPEDNAFVFYLGDDALLRADHAQALAYYQAVLKLQPDNPAANNNVAWLLKVGKKPGALVFAEKANRLLPQQPAFMDTLAEIHADAGRLDKALEVQKQAVALAPELHLHRLHLARYYLQSGQKSAAQEELEKLAALGSKFGRQDEVKKLQGEL